MLFERYTASAYWYVAVIFWCYDLRLVRLNCICHSGHMTLIVSHVDGTSQASCPTTKQQRLV